MIKVFISYKHDDKESKNAVNSIIENSNNTIQFFDNSLQQPVDNIHGDINRRSPHDIASNPVNAKILQLIEGSDKLLVLIGENTHSSEWVNWEIKIFRRLRCDSHILLMRVPQGIQGGIPLAAGDLEIYGWNMKTLSDFIVR